MWTLRQGINNLIGPHHNIFEDRNRLGFLLTITATRRTVRAYPNNPLYPQGKPDACRLGISAVLRTPYGGHLTVELFARPHNDPVIRISSNFFTSPKGMSAHLLKFLAIYLRREHLQKYPYPKVKLNLHSRELSSKHSTSSPS